MTPLAMRILCAALGILWAGSGAAALPDPAASGGQISDDAIDRAGDRVMNGNEFRSVRRMVLETTPTTSQDNGFLLNSLEWLGDQIGNVLQAIGDFFTWLFSSSGTPAQRPPVTAGGTPPTPAASSGGGAALNLSQLMTVVMIGVIIIILTVIVAMIVKSIDAKKRRGPGLPDLSNPLSDVTTPPGDLAATTYEGRALQLAASGNHRAAIRELLLGSMSWIERAGMIRYRRGLTNRDYLRSLWRRPDKRDAYAVTARHFELVYFGRRQPSQTMFELCLAEFQGAFREEEVPTPAV